MARSNIPMVINLRQNTNDDSTAFGTFSPSVDGQGNGKNDIETAVAGGADAMINGIRINFTPELACAEEGVRLRVGLRGGERRTHHRREEEALPEQDADQLRARTPGRQFRRRR